MRVNLLRAGPQRRHRTEPSRARRPGALAGSVLLTLTSCALGVWAIELRSESARLDRELAGARHELSRLRTSVALGEAVAHASDTLQQRIGVLEQLRLAQREPGAILEEISRALPADCWLTAITQESADAVRIDGRGPALSSLFDFVERLQGPAVFAGGAEVLESRLDESDTDELIIFSVRVSLRPPAVAAEPAAKRQRPQGTGTHR